jgi:type IV fimbrial biogenesis protein FimT
MGKTHKRQQGFTLQELLIAMAVFGILVLVGIPSFMAYVRNSQISSTSLNFYTDILYARSEAIKRKTDIHICRSADVEASPPSCGGTANTWTKGWLVFIDKGGTTNEYDDGTDTLLRVGQPVNTNVSIVSNANADADVRFDDDGALVVSGGDALFAVCDDRDQDGNLDEANGREIRIKAIGRAEINKPPSDCAAPS